MELVLRVFERLIALLCVGTAVCLLPLLIGVRVWEIYARNVLERPSALYGYMEGEAFFLLICLALAYAYTRDAHVRVDVLRARMGPKSQAVIEVMGYLAFILPFAVIVVFYGIDRVVGVAELGQRSALALGRPWGWVVQAAMPFGIGLLGFAGLVAMIRNLRFLVTGRGSPSPAGDGLQTARPLPQSPPDG